MNDFVQFFTYLSSTPLFGLAATLSAYVAAQSIYMRLHANPLANPVLLSVAALIVLLLITHTPYPKYFAGAQFIHFLLGPAVVAMAWPMWLRRQMLLRHTKALFVAALVGLLVGCGTAVLMGWGLGLPPSLLRSIAPKAITTPVAMGITQSIHGVPELTAMFVLITGLLGAVGGKYVLDAIGVREAAARGFALGAQAHGFGTARALHVNAEAGAFAGLALGMQALIGSVLIPLIAALF